MKEKLTSDISANIAERKKWAKRDDLVSEWLLWLSVLSSFLTAIVAVDDQANKYVVATLGALSGVVGLIDKNFTFSKRSTWNELYRIDMERFLDQLDGSDPSTVAAKYRSPQEKKEREWGNKAIWV